MALFLAVSSVWGQNALRSYVTFLPAERIDSVWEYAATDVIPIIYRVNLHHLVRNAQLDTLAAVIDSVRADSSVRFRYVYVGGSASPEGPVWWNKDLGRYRAGELTRFLLRETTLGEREMRVENLMEDWGSVVRTLSRPDFRHPDWVDVGRVLDIIASEDDWVRRKQKIRRLDGSRTWWWLVHEVFPPLRNSRLVIVCEQQPLAMSVPALNVAAERVVEPSWPWPEYVPEAAPDFAPWPRKMIAVKTNLAFAAALVANVGVEVELWPHTSLDVPFYYSPYDISETWRIRLFGVQPELRWWPRRAGEGWFVGAHGTVMGFNVSVNDNGRYQDPNHALWGLGLGCGWAAHFGASRRWGIEMNVGGGFFRYQSRAYRNWHNGPKFRRDGTRTWWGPTRVGVTLTYQWRVPRKTRRGML